MLHLNRTDSEGYITRQQDNAHTSDNLIQTVKYLFVWTNIQNIPDACYSEGQATGQQGNGQVSKVSDSCYFEGQTTGQLGNGQVFVCTHNSAVLRGYYLMGIIMEFLAQDICQT